MRGMTAHYCHPMRVVAKSNVTVDLIRTREELGQIAILAPSCIVTFS